MYQCPELSFLWGDSVSPEEVSKEVWYPWCCSPSQAEACTCWRTDVPRHVCGEKSSSPNRKPFTKICCANNFTKILHKFVKNIWYKCCQASKNDLFPLRVLGESSSVHVFLAFLRVLLREIGRGKPTTDLKQKYWCQTTSENGWSFVFLNWMLIFWIWHHFLGTPVSIIWSY